MDKELDDVISSNQHLKKEMLLWEQKIDSLQKLSLKVLVDDEISLSENKTATGETMENMRKQYQETSEMNRELTSKVDTL
jgi:hypothetical protein